jgi:hypothetical protein
MGIEPTQSAWKAEVLPLNYARKTAIFSWQARRESNPQPTVLETAALPIELLT